MIFCCKVVPDTVAIAMVTCALIFSFFLVQDSVNALLQLYLVHLIDSGQHALLPLYACHLRADVRREVLALPVPKNLDRCYRIA